MSDFYIYHTYADHIMDQSLVPFEAARLLVDQGLFNGIMIWVDHHKRKIPPPPAEWLKAHNLSVIFEFYTNDHYAVPCARNEGFGHDLNAYNEFWCKTIIEYLTALGPTRAFWVTGCENYDSFALYPSLDSKGELGHLRPADRYEGFEMYKRWITTNKHQLHWAHSRGKPIPTSPGYRLGKMTDQPDTFSFLAQRGWSISHSLALGGTLPQNAHYQFELIPGQEAFCWECLHSRLPAVQPGMCFLRGACAQYGRTAIVDVAPYAGFRARHDDISMQAAPGMENYCKNRMSHTCYDDAGNRLGGYSESLFARAWMSLWTGGIEHILQEDSVATHLRMNGKILELSPLGRAHAEFANLALRRARDRGDVIRTAGIVLPFLHGLCPPPMAAREGWPDKLRPWHGIEPTPGDWRIACFFELAFPDHGKVPPWPYPYDQMAQDEAFRHFGRLARMGLDTRALEEKHVTASRWGNGFDVLLDQADLAILRRYPALVLLGDFDKGAPIVDRLPEYVTSGGRAIVSRDFPGLSRFGLSPSHNKAGAEMKILMRDAAGAPTLAEYGWGKGVLWVVEKEDSAAYYPQDASRYPGFLAEALDLFFVPTIPLRVRGPLLEWSVARNGQGLRIYAANHHPYDVLPEFRIQLAACGVTAVRKETALEYIAEHQVSLRTEGDHVRFEMAIPAFGFRLVDVPCV